MCGEFGEVTVIIGLVINFLAFVSLLFAFRDTSTYANDEQNIIYVVHRSVTHTGMRIRFPGRLLRQRGS